MLYFNNTLNSITNCLKKLVSKTKRLFIDPFSRPDNPPWYDARGVFVGLFIGVGIPLGAQTIFIGLLRLLIRFNLLVALAFTWINNPISVGPMYYAFYRIGSFLLNRRPVTDFNEFHNVLIPIFQATRFGDACARFLALGGDIVLRWFIGSFIVAIPLGLVGYFISLRIQTSRLQKRNFLRLSDNETCSQRNIENK